MNGIFSTLFVPFMTFVFGVFIGYMYRSQLKQSCNKTSDCDFTCWQGYCEPRSFLPLEVQAVINPQDAAEKATVQPKSTVFNTKLPPGWTHEDVTAASKLTGKPDVLEKDDFDLYHPIVLKRIQSPSSPK